MSLAARTASSSVSKRYSGATGPKISSQAMRMSLLTSARMVGWKKVPPRGWRAPPSTTRAPFSTASCSSPSTFCTAASLISGPWVTPSRVPSPTSSFATASARRRANSS